MKCPLLLFCVLCASAAHISEAADTVARWHGPGFEQLSPGAIALREGARYEVRCRIRWDNFTPDTPPPIVNYGIFHEPTRTWYGPVDQVLEKTGDWHEYRFIHIPPFPGPWKLYVQLNGWGNFGRGVTVSVDNFQCVPRR